MKNNKAVSVLIQEQLKWTLWFIGILYLVRIGVFFLDDFSQEPDLTELVFLNFAYDPSKIYMLVIGLMSVYMFLGFCIEHGLTRKHYYQAAALSATALALFITALIILIAVIDSFIFGTDPAAFHLIEAETTAGSLAASFPAYFITVFMYYVLGMFVNSGFYRFGWIAGLGFVAVGFIFLLVESLIWGTYYAVFNIGVLTEGLSVVPAVLATAVLTAVIYSTAASVLKKTPVKIE
jgi:hypothetical protein